MKYKVLAIAGDAYSAGWHVGDFGGVDAAHIAADGCAYDGYLGGEF